MKKSLFTPRLLAQSGIIAAIYVAVTLANMMWSYGMIQIRISEALAVLSLFTPAAIPGLFIGCLIANILSPTPNIVDIIFGSLATLIATTMTYQIGKDLAATRIKELPTFLTAMIPPVLVNAIIVGSFVHFLWYPAVPVYFVMLSVGIGQVIACYGLGAILYIALKKIPFFRK